MLCHVMLCHVMVIDVMLYVVCLYHSLCIYSIANHLKSDIKIECVRCLFNCHQLHFTSKQWIVMPGTHQISCYDNLVIPLSFGDNVMTIDIVFVHRKETIRLIQ